MLLAIKTWTRGNSDKFPPVAFDTRKDRNYSCRLSIRAFFNLRDFWIGFYLDRSWSGEWKLYICPLPCCVVRLHYIRSYAGRFSPRRGLLGLKEL